MAHIVSSPLVAVNGADGKVKYLYRGTIVPSDVSEKDIKRLVADGLIEKVSAASAAEPEPQDKAGDSSDRPAESGNGSGKDKWVAYAAAHEVEIEPESSREDIIAAVTAAGH